MARLSQREGSWRYKTGPGQIPASLGFEAFSQVAQEPTFLDRLYVSTISLPIFNPVLPFWILIFDRSTGQSNDPNQQSVPPPNLSIADFSSPPILVAGSVFVFEPPIRSYAIQIGEEQFQGEPFNTGILVIPSSTPVFLTQIPVPPGISGLISTRARGVRPTELRERQRAQGSGLETQVVGKILTGR